MKKLTLGILLVLLFSCIPSPAISASLTWTASPGAVVYVIYYNEYSQDVGDVTLVEDAESVLNLVHGVEYSLSCTAYNDCGESAKCSAITYTRPLFVPSENPAPTIINIPPGSPVIINVEN